MPKHVFLVRSGPSSPERTDEYNDWYDNIHLPDLLDVKGVVGASRYRVAKAQQGGPIDGPQYLAIYEIDIDDVQDFLDDMMRAATDGSRWAGRLYFDCGADDDLAPESEKLHKLLQQAHIAHHYALIPGDHSWDTWRERLPVSLRFLQQALHRLALQSEFPRRLARRP